MQRLFPAFARGWPGVGLLVLRLMLAGGLCVDAIARLNDSATAQILLALGGIVSGMLLLIGLWTPIVGSAVCLIQLAVVATLAGAIEPALQRAAVGLCLVLLGPGTWSIDARLFGPRRVKLKSFHHN